MSQTKAQLIGTTYNSDAVFKDTLKISSGTSGDAKLIIESDTSNINGVETYNPEILLIQDGGLTNSKISISGDTFTDTTSKNVLVIVNQSTNGAGGIHLRTIDSSFENIDSAATRLCITSGGNVGINTINPLTSLQVNGVITAGTSSVVDGGIGSIEILDDGVDSGLAIYNNTNAGLSFRMVRENNIGYFTRAENKYVSLDTDGNFGLGVDDPGVKLDVYQATNTSASATGTTMARFTNYVGTDLVLQKSFIDFVFTDDNDNETPQVRIGAEVGDNGNADNQTEEGCGSFVVYTNSADTDGGAAGASLSEKFRVDYRGTVRSPLQPYAMVYKTGQSQSLTNNAIIAYDATGASHDLITINANRSRMTVSSDGKYLVSATISGAVTTADAADGLQFILLRNGVVYVNTNLYPFGSSGAIVGEEFSFSFSIIANATSGDYFECQFTNVDSAGATANYGNFYMYLLG